MYLELAHKYGYHGLLSILDTFQHLTVLRVQVSAIANLSFHPDSIINELNCQQLKWLIFEFSDLIAGLDDKPPNLELLQMYRFSDRLEEFSGQESMYYTSEEKWNRKKERFALYKVL